MSFSIEPAYLFKTELLRMLIKAGVDNRNEWFFHNGAITKADSNEFGDCDTWNYENYVVVSNQSIIGYLNSKWSRPLDVITGLRFILFNSQKSFSFMKAIAEYFSYLFISRGCNVINWSVAVKDNRMIHLSNKFIKNYFGHKIGIRTHAHKSYSGLISDIELFEATELEYINWTKNGK